MLHGSHVWNRDIDPELAFTLIGEIFAIKDYCVCIAGTCTEGTSQHRVAPTGDGRAQYEDDHRLSAPSRWHGHYLIQVPRRSQEHRCHRSLCGVTS